MIIHGIEIKPGMILYETRKNAKITLVAVPFGINSIEFCNITEGGLSPYYGTFLHDIEEIRDLPKDSNGVGGNILWEKPKEIILTIEDIREKFNIPKNTKIII